MYPILQGDNVLSKISEPVSTTRTALKATDQINYPIPIALNIGAVLMWPHTRWPSGDPLTPFSAHRSPGRTSTGQSAFQLACAGRSEPQFRARTLRQSVRHLARGGSFCPLFGRPTTRDCEENQPAHAERSRHADPGRLDEFRRQWLQIIS